MNKSPIREAIERLTKFSESLDFSKEAMTGVNCSISLIQPLLEKEKKLYESICISDEEINQSAPMGNPTLEEGFIRGAKWYREQLKNK